MDISMDMHIHGNCKSDLSTLVSCSMFVFFLALLIAMTANVSDNNNNFLFLTIFLLF